MKRITDFIESEPCQKELSEAMEYWRRCRVVHRLPYTCFSKVLKTGTGVKEDIQTKAKSHRKLSVDHVFSRFPSATAFPACNMEHP